MNTVSNCIIKLINTSFIYWFRILKRDGIKVMCEKKSELFPL